MNTLFFLGFFFFFFDNYQENPTDHFEKICLITRTSGSYTITLGKIKSEADGSCLQILSRQTTRSFVFPRIYPRRQTGGGRRKTPPSVRHNYTCDGIWNIPLLHHRCVLVQGLDRRRCLTWTGWKLNKIPKLLESSRKLTKDLGQGSALDAQSQTARC